MSVNLAPHEWLKEVREDKGIRQTDVEARSIEIDPELKISQSHLSKIEKGHTPLDGLGARKLDVLRRILGISPELWVEKTGLDLVTKRSASPLSAAALYSNIPIQDIEVPDSLKEAARLYGDLPAFAGIRDTRWQQFMLGGGHGVSRKRTPATPEEWVEEFTSLKRMGFGPDELKE